MAYRYLGSDAVLDAFTNSDFRLGRPLTARAPFSVLNYGVDKNTWVSARWYVFGCDRFDGAVYFGLLVQHEVLGRLDQFDLNTRF